MESCVIAVIFKWTIACAYCQLANHMLHVLATRCQHWWRDGPQVNKFEQVSSDGYQMSLVNRSKGLGSGVGIPLSEIVEDLDW